MPAPAVKHYRLLSEDPVRLGRRPPVRRLSLVRVAPSPAPPSLDRHAPLERVAGMSDAGADATGADPITAL